MPKFFVSNKDETARIFKSDFPEALSKVHPAVPLIVYIPVVIASIAAAFVIDKMSVVFVIPAIIFGVALWTITEYLLHRFLFHYEPKGDLARKIHWTFHGVHHDYPQDSKRLVMPPSVSLPLAVLFYFLFVIIFGPIGRPLFAGFVLGYLAYDMTHYAVHHFAFRNKYLLAMKAHHMTHHYRFPDKGFGVSNKFWDKVFGTEYPK